MIGGACTVVIDAALVVAPATVEENLQIIRDFCRGMMSISPETQVYAAIQPQLSALLEALPSGSAGLEPLIDDLAGQIQVSANVGA